MVQTQNIQTELSYLLRLLQTVKTQDIEEDQNCIALNKRTPTKSPALLLRGMIVAILASVFRLATGKKLRRLNALRFLHVVIAVGMVAL
jgi:hypothetical protein